MKEAANPQASGNSDLHRSVGFLGVMGQSVSGVAPTATPTVNIALIFVVAGNGSWLAYLIATVAILLVALNIVPLAHTFSGAGSLSEFVGQGIGNLGRLVTAWALLLAYLAVSVATLAACTGYLSSLFEWTGVSLPLVVWVLLAGGLAAWFALREIRLSTGLMLGMECFSILLVLLLGAAILFRQGSVVDMAQFKASHLTAAGLNGGLLIGVLSFVGFEAAAALGDEAKNPLRDIPRALILTPVLTGLFFVFSAYVIVLGFNRYEIAVATSEAPLDDLAHAMKLPGLGLLVSFGAAVSLFACAIATMVAASRMAYALARQRALPAVLGQVTGKHSSPRLAVAIAAGVVLSFALTLATFAKPLDIYDWLGTFGTFGCITAYALTCVAAPVFLRRAGKLRTHHRLASAFALGVLGFVIYGSIYPTPAAPMNYLPWLFIGLLAGGVGYSWFCRKR